MPNIGIWEILLLFLVLLLIFGPKRLPGMGKAMGRGVREFKESVTDQSKELKEAAQIMPDEFKEGFSLEDEPEEESEEQEAAEPAPAPSAEEPARRRPPAEAAPAPEEAAPAPEEPASAREATSEADAEKVSG